MQALDVAKYFLFLARSKEAGDTISNLKIQKMLYYAQAYSLLFREKPLFDERIEAWKHGPVVKEVYNEFKRYGVNSISFDEINDFSTDLIGSDEEILNLLIFIFNKYGSMSASYLSNKTHEEEPWKKTFNENLRNEITQETILKFFKEENKKEALRLTELKKTDEDIKQLWR